MNATEGRMVGAKHLSIEKVPPLKQNKDCEEFGEFKDGDALQPPHLLNQPKQGEENEEEKNADDGYTPPHAWRNDKGVTRTRLVVHHFTRRRQRRQRHSRKSIHDEVNPKYLRHRKRELRTDERTCKDEHTAESRAGAEITRNEYLSATAGKKTASVKRYIYEKNDEIYLIPRGVRPYPSLRYLMTGLHLATRKKDRVLPSQALAEALFEGEWGREFNMACDDIRVMKYLRGETLSAFEEEIATHEPALKRLLGDIDPAVLFTSTAGGSRKTRDKKKDKSILILIEGFPVGFGSYDRGLIKNKRAPGRRLL